MAISLFFDFSDPVRKSFKGLCISVVPGVVGELWADPLPYILVDRPSGVGGDRLHRVCPEIIVRYRSPAESDEVKLGRQEVIKREVGDRGNEFALRQVAGCAKNHKDGRRGSTVFAETI